MKKLFAIAAMILLSTGVILGFGTPDGHKDKGAPATEAIAEAVVLKGNVVDSQTLESLTGVALEIVGTKAVVYTDFDGNFTIEDLEPGYYNIIVRYVSYQGHLIENVYLNLGLNTLHQIKLMAN
jgi:hypothetical protein